MVSRSACDSAGWTGSDSACWAAISGLLEVQVRREVRERREPVVRDGVVDAAAHAPVAELGRERVAVGADDADRVLVPHVRGLGGDLGTTTPCRWALRNAALSWRCLVQPGSFASWARPIAACTSVMRALKPMTSFSYRFSMPWLR